MIYFIRYLLAALLIWSFGAQATFAQTQGTEISELAAPRTSAPNLLPDGDLPAPPVDKASDLEFSPLIFNRQTGPTIFPANRLYDIKDVGTIELGISIPKFESGDFPEIMTLFTHGNKKHSRFRIYIAGGGSILIVTNGVAGKFVGYDFREGGNFQIAVAVRHDVSQIFINGDHQADLDVGFGPATNAPLFLGAEVSGRHRFLGKIHYLRLWDIELTSEILNQTDAFGGRVTGVGHADDYLVAFSQFTNKGAEILATREVTEDSTVYVGGYGYTDGDLIYKIVPPHEGITKIAVIGEKAIKRVQLTIIDNLGIEQDITVETGKVRTEQENICTTNGNNMSCQVLLADPVFVEVFSKPKKLSKIFVAGNPERRQISGLQFGFADGTATAVYGNPVPSDDQLVDEITPGRQLAAITAYGDTQLNFFTIQESPPTQITDFSGRWVLDVSQPPRKLPISAAQASNGTGLLHGTYTEQPIVTFSKDPALGFKEIKMMMSYSTVFGSNGVPELAPHSETKFFNRDSNTPNTYVSSKRNGGLTLQFLTDGTALLHGKYLRKVISHERLLHKDHSFNEFGGTFNLDHQVPFTHLMFQGHDIAYINPVNLQDSTSVRKPVFAEPKATSLDFYPSYQKIIPLGLLHMPDIQEQSHRDVRTIQSSHDYAREQSHSLGFNIGVPAIGAFGANSSVQNKMERQSSKKETMALGKDIRTERALVVDSRHMQLSPVFEKRVRDLLQAKKLGTTPDWRSFINEFGTHFANAMTIGSVRTDKLNFSSESYGELYEEKRSLSVHASGVIRGAQLGINSSNEHGMSERFQDEMEEQHEELQAVGGENQAVPVFYDLRTLDNLLAPPFFKDRDITRYLKNSLSKAIKRYIAGAIRTMRPEDIWEPYVFEVGVKELIHTKFNFNERDPAKNKHVIPKELSMTHGSKTIFKFDENELTGLRFGEIDEPGTIEKKTLQRFVSSAVELCNRSGTLGSDIHITFIVENMGSGSKQIRLTHQDINLMHLNKIKQEFKKQETLRGGTVSGYVTTARRLPDIDGGFKEMPTCN